MKNMGRLCLVMVLPLLALGLGATEAKAELGLGIHYLHTVGDLKDAEGFDSGALGFLFGLGLGEGLIRFEGDLEWIPDYAFGKDMWQPQGYVLLGKFIYGGVGMGIGRINGNWQDSPFYALRAGVNIAMLDVFTSYRFQSWNAVEDFASDDLNSLTFGAMIKF